MKRSAVCCIIVGNEILLLERPLKDAVVSGWCVPGGKRDEGESEEACALRELKEETGIVTSDPGYAGDYISSVKEHIVSVYYKKLDKKPKVKISKEHDSYRWESLDTVANCGLAGNTYTFIKSVLNVMNNGNS